MTAGAAWCGQCYAQPQAARPQTTPAATTTGFRAGGASPSQGAPVAVLMRTTRWGKTQTTFGPVGRIVCTIGVIVPLLVMIAGGFVDVFAWGGALVYLAVIVPWAMREIWEAGRVPVG